jgi:hypothetical protein
MSTLGVLEVTESKMKLRRILASIAVCILWGLITSNVAFGATPEQHLEKAQDLWEVAAGDKAPTLGETDSVIQVLRQALSAPVRLKFEDEKAARLLLAKVYQAKYSLLESPDWKNTKGGLEYLKKAKSELELLIKRKPGDKETLLEYLSVLNLLRVESLPTLKQLVAFHPSDSWVRYLLALEQLRSGNLVEGHESLSRAISLSESAAQLRVYLDSAEAEFLTLGCPVSATLLKGRQKLPEEHDANPLPTSAKNKQVNTKSPNLQALKKEILADFSAHKCEVK